MSTNMNLSDQGPKIDESEKVRAERELSKKLLIIATKQKRIDKGAKQLAKTLGLDQTKRDKKSALIEKNRIIAEARAKWAKADKRG